MATLTLHHFSDASEHTKMWTTPTRTFYKLSNLVAFCQQHKIVSETRVTQHEPDDDYNITLTVQEVVDVYETGECPEDLDFF